MFYQAKKRAKNTGCAFSITLDDIAIPNRCPLLGVHLKRGVSSKLMSNTPSLDRLVPALGYIPSNIIVVSYRANRIKNDATLQELKDLTKNLEKILSERIHTWNGGTHEKSSHRRRSPHGT